MNHLDLFSGIGGFSLGLKQAGIEPDWIGFSDIDKYANKLFKRRFPNAKELGSITTIQPDKLPKIDLITFGFPCQDLSIAGKRGGLEANRSSLFFEAIKIIQHKKPKYFIFENVKGLFSSNGGKDFDIVLRTIADIGYDGQWELCNTRWYLPQNRERIYFVGHIRGEPRPKVFPLGENDKEIKDDGERKKLNQIATIGEDSEATRVYDTTCARTIKNGGGMGAKTGLYRLDDVKLIAKKRTHDTPKEINAYLKKYKDRTITEIAKELDLPKTQVEHYFREDKYRAIPSPEIWLQLKDLLGFDDTYDKQVTEIYEKEYEFESAKRVYDARGIAQTLDTGKTGLYKVKSAALRGRDNNPSGNLEIRNDDVANCIIKGSNSSLVTYCLDTVNSQAVEVKSAALRTWPRNSGMSNDEKSKRGKRLEVREDNTANTITTHQLDSVLFEQPNIRRLTPTECERLQGFPDGWTDGQSDTQRYKQLGNAVSVPVVKAVMERLYETKTN